MSYGRCKALVIEPFHLVCITFAVTRTGGAYNNSTYYTFFNIPDTYAPTADVFFKGAVQGMIITYSGKVTKYGEVMGYNADNTNNGARLGSTNTGSVVYYCN